MSKTLIALAVLSAAGFARGAGAQDADCPAGVGGERRCPD
jgi:hypothetical protein